MEKENSILADAISKSCNMDEFSEIEEMLHYYLSIAPRLYNDKVDLPLEEWECIFALKEESIEPTMFGIWMETWYIAFWIIGDKFGYFQCKDCGSRGSMLVLFDAKHSLTSLIRAYEVEEFYHLITDFPEREEDNKRIWADNFCFLDDEEKLKNLENEN